MDPIITIQKIQAIKRSRSMKKQHHQLLDNLFLYSLIAIASTLVFSIPFWLRTFVSSIRIFHFFTLPKTAPSVLNTKVLFIISNVIVIFLVGKSKFYGSKPSFPASDFYYEEYIKGSHTLRSQVKKSEEIIEKSSYEKYSGELSLEEYVEKTNAPKIGKVVFDWENELSLLPADELNKRADDLIARVNRQRKIEAKLFLSGSSH